jgi:cation/acetate symporter
MYADPQHDRDRIDGLTTFAAAAFLTGMGLVAALARVGAPDRLVEALGPLIALVGLAIIGVLTRTARLSDFLAAGRAIPAAYGGLAFAATAAGLVLTLQAGDGGRGALPLPAAALGVVVAALLVGPLLRRANVSALSDVLATRFPAHLTRAAFALVLWSAGVLVASAGLDTAVGIVVFHVGQSRRVAEIVVAFALAMTVVPGGLKGLLWSDAASAGGALAIAAIGAGLAWLGLGAPEAPLAQTAAGWLAPPHAPVDAADLLFEIAVTLGVGALFAFAPPAIGAPPGQATRAGLYGLVFGVAGLALGATGLAAFWPNPATAPATAGALVGAATWLPALALARAGVLGAARAAGVDLGAAYTRLTVLASARIARTRLMMLAVIVLATIVSDARILDPAKAVALALAITLALVLPSLVLAATTRWRSPAAFAALATGVAGLGRVGLAGGPSIGGRDLLIGALIAGAAALLVGAAVGLAAAVAFGQQRRVTRADPFGDLRLGASD